MSWEGNDDVPIRGQRRLTSLRNGTAFQRGGLATTQDRQCIGGSGQARRIASSFGV
jgi:hypothetical protein